MKFTLANLMALGNFHVRYGKNSGYPEIEGFLTLPDNHQFAKGKRGASPRALRGVTGVCELAIQEKLARATHGVTYSHWQLLQQSAEMIWNAFPLIRGLRELVEGDLRQATRRSQRVRHKRFVNRTTGGTCRVILVIGLVICAICSLYLASGYRKRCVCGGQRPRLPALSALQS